MIFDELRAELRRLRDVIDDMLAALGDAPAARRSLARATADDQLDMQREIDRLLDAHGRGGNGNGSQN